MGLFLFVFDGGGGVVGELDKRFVIGSLDDHHDGIETLFGGKVDFGDKRLELSEGVDADRIERGGRC